MAEQVVILLLDKIADYLIEGAAGLWPKDLKLRDQIEWVEGELRRMQCFIKDVDSRQDVDERVKNWVADLREVAYDTDDILDSFVYSLVQGQQRGVLVTFLKRYFLSFNELVLCRKLNDQIKRIRIRLQEISDRKSTYGIGNIGIGTEGAGFAASRLQERRRSSVHVCEDIVGLVEDVKIIESQLIHGESRRCVVSVVGMAGIGKTTLAKRVYLKSDLKEHVDCCAFVYVSQNFRAREILQELGKKLMGNVGGDFGRASNEELREIISSFLESKRYLIVLDDLWNFADWDDLKAAFPEEKNGSRILLTTRIKDVALYADSKSTPHELCLMNDEDCWKLFSKMVQLDWESSASLPPWAEELGKQMLRRCGGLPLAIVVLGGLLSRKDATFNEWQKVFQSMHWQLRQEPMQYGDVLALSYRDLPHYLKSCFLYFGLFPEDFEISARRLMLLWVAEGFVLPRGQQPLEDVAEDYLEELIGRNMVQVAKRKSNGRIKACRIHDLLRDLSISIAKEEHFLDFIHGDVNADSVTTRCRRLGIHSGEISITENTPKVRSLLCFDSVESNFKPRKVKLLRVLDLEGAYLTQLDSEIGNLIHLRYLSLRETWLKRFPSTIGYLEKLQTLDLRSTLISPIPLAIWKLLNLRFLYFNELKEMVVDPPKDAALTHLQTLQGLCISQKSRIENGLDKLTNLRELELHGELYAQEVALAKWILNSKNLECLKLHANPVTAFLVDAHTKIQDFDRTRLSIPKSTMFADHFFLSKLHLDGYIKKLYDVEHFPPNLEELSLKDSYLMEDPMPKLEKLQNLRVLKLKQCAYVGKELVCSSGGFPQLHLLKLSFLTLQTWRIEEGSLCNLKQLEIVECKQLKILPRGLHPLTSLKDLRLGYMPHEFALKARDRAGENWYRIHRVPPL